MFSFFPFFLFVCVVPGTEPRVHMCFTTEVAIALSTNYFLKSFHYIEDSCFKVESSILL